ncbi:MAG: response regulator [Cytophagales bacterium]|nr:response regulator [Cytophagales bacterium]
MRLNNTVRYTLFGVAFWLLFPCWGPPWPTWFCGGLPISWKSVVVVQSSSYLHWIIDTAPVFLGLFASMAGVRQDRFARFNHTLGKLVDERTDELLRLNQEMKVANKQLQEEKERAEASTKAKTEFLANMSHELRTPLNGVIGIAEILSGSNNCTPEQKQLVDSIHKLSNLLLNLINDVLDFSKIESGKVELVCSEEGLAPLLADVVELLRPQWSAKGLLIKTSQAPDTPATVHTDVLRLRQVLINLVGNAIKFTEKGEVNLHVSLGSEGRLQFSISDTGIGIDPQKLDSIFDEFVQEDSSTSRRYGGTGLGLAISTRLVRLLGGRIWARSQPGQGTTFYFEISPMPVSQSAPLPGLVHPAEEAPESRQGLKILLAEDNDVNQLVGRKALEMSGFGCELAVNGEQAVQMHRERGYDLIFMDVQMPVIDGLEATRLIRQDDTQVKIIALTANASADDRQRCLAAGMDDYLAKPFRFERIKELILLHTAQRA